MHMSKRVTVTDEAKLLVVMLQVRSGFRVTPSLIWDLPKMKWWEIIKSIEAQDPQGKTTTIQATQTATGV